MKSPELRKKFFDFFVRHRHEKVASSSLIPAQDPTLLFTNAGMNQFKDVFLGKEKRSYTRAVTVQKCVRAGGKHNDLDNVGFTQRHLTFFEMMGNFSFGDYFKKEAIQFSWDFLTKEVGLDIDKLYVTVHVSDQESYDIWNKQIGLAPERIFKLDEDNFWQMGDVGPCGPSTEMFVDRGPTVGCAASDCSPACDCDRFLEVWNDVFMQFNRQDDGTDVPLKQTGVDTGMGIERLALIVQGKESVFDTDLFRPIFDKIEELTGHKYHGSAEEIKTAFNVLGDHVRSSTFLIGDGCAPANDGRGYVLRKIIRRAALFAQKLTDKNIFPELSCVLIDYMTDAYPELVIQKDRIASVLKIEIERFSDNLTRGKRILQEYMDNNKDKKIVDGKQAFTLYDTYGFPYEVTELVAKEQGFEVDKDGFEQHMDEQRQRSGKKMKQVEQGLELGVTTEFTGYDNLAEEGTVLKFVTDNQAVDQVAAGQECWFVADKTPFYVECGGQVNDKGTVSVDGKSAELLDLKNVDGAILIKIKAPVDMSVGDSVQMEVEQYWRQHTMKNHTATHLLQASLQLHLGKQVKQAGSVVTRDYLRFDYTHHQSLTAEQIKQVEDTVNQKIWENIPVVVKNTTYKDAVDQGVIAFFGDKYNPDNVRAIIISEFSKELCGGTHVKATGDIGVFKIIEEVALAAGQRRIVAYTGGKALQEFQQDFSVVKQLCQDLKIKPKQVLQSVQSIQDKTRELQREIKQLKKQQWKQQVSTWLQHVQDLSGLPYLFLQIDGYGADDMREISQTLQQKNPGFYFLLQSDEKKSMFLASLDKSLTDKVDFKEFKQFLQQACALRGGGNQTTLQGGGPKLDVSACDKKIKQWFQEV